MSNKLLHGSKFILCDLKWSHSKTFVCITTINACTYTHLSHFEFDSIWHFYQSYISYYFKICIIIQVCMCSRLHQDNTTHFQIWCIHLWIHIWLLNPRVIYHYCQNMCKYRVTIGTHHSYTNLSLHLSYKLLH